jgi:Glycosyltransferase family 28 C-terminal domain
VSKICFVYFDAGSGHRSAMNALRSVILEQQRPWEVTCLNLQEELDIIDFAKRLTGRRVEDIYNLLLERGWTLGTTQLLPILHGAIRFQHARIVHLLERYWRATKPDLVVSLIPNFNRELAQSVCNALPSVPFVTVITDLADYPPHTWIEPESEYLICGTERAAQQARVMGHPPERVFSTSGMVLNPAFYTARPINRAEYRRSLGLEARLITGLVLFGGHGSQDMLDIAKRLNSFEGLQLIFICGRNQKLETSLRRMHFRIPVHIEGFTSEVPAYMQVSDFFIGKPGPGSISEALLMRLPVIVQRSAWTLPQERFNTEWIRAKDVGIVVPSFRHIHDAVRRLVEPASFARFRANVHTLHNRAVYEVPEILQTILERKKGGLEAGGPPA